MTGAAAFDAGLDRRGTASAKWLIAGCDQDPSRIALGLADMDLPVFPGILDAIRDRLRHPAFGYTVSGAASRATIACWYWSRFGVEVDPDWVVLTPFGAKAAVQLVLDVTAPGRRVLCPTPEYGGFRKLVRSAGAEYVEVPLTKPRYSLPIDTFADEARHGIGAVVLSSPHNPTGRVWSAAEIRGLAEIAATSKALLIADEVHSDLIYDDRSHPVAVSAAGDLAEHALTVHSAGKTFNVTGIPSAFLLVPSAPLRRRLTDALDARGFYQGTLLGTLIQDVAFTHGGPWRQSLVKYLQGNRDLLIHDLAAAPALVATVPEATYLLWLDFAPLGRPAANLREDLLSRSGLDLQDGRKLGAPGHLRLNFALPRPRLREVIHRLNEATESGVLSR